MDSDFLYGFCDFIQETVEMQKKWGSVTCLFGELYVYLPYCIHLCMKYGILLLQEISG